MEKIDDQEQKAVDKAYEELDKLKELFKPLGSDRSKGVYRMTEKLKEAISFLYSDKELECDCFFCTVQKKLTQDLKDKSKVH